MTFGKFIKIALLTILALLTAAGSFVFFWYRSGGLQKTIVSEVGRRFISAGGPAAPAGSPAAEEQAKQLSFVQEFFGFQEPQTYLILFLNNTELRPGGGFIGTYAVVKMGEGYPEVLKVEGTEILDNLAPKDFPSIPPTPIKQFLGLERWYFRDSNWSPDFAVSAAKSLELYRKEKGTAAEEIHTVIGFTPTLIEELLKITGPVSVNGEEFTADNFTEKLEYEVEYGFAKKGITVDERKKMLVDLAKSVIMSTAKSALTNWGAYKDLVERMLKDKQMIMYSENKDYQSVFAAKHWDGTMSNENFDYLLWADANLGALKTDVAIDRTLSYEIKPAADGKYIAKVKMTFVHHGKFDWRTTRYRDYARVFVPAGSQLIRATGSMKEDWSKEPGPIDQGIENGRRWFGAFISIEPGKTGELSFEYYVAPEVLERLKANDYRLLVQKQLGTNNVRLTLGLNFAKQLAYAAPGESQHNHGDNRYDYSTTLLTDLDFEVRTK
ncbi:MAG: DUF4012 domain-containing protein [Patescibacteria group bacterium]|nr:DUF4012 domain-containing protein [Patescibacteria group bacterium]